MDAVRKLFQNPRPFNLKDGIQGWSDAGLPITK